MMTLFLVLEKVVCCIAAISIAVSFRTTLNISETAKE
jgi:hypothetical protein